MKIKEISKTAHISWSPSKIYPSYIVCGTAAQQLDASFSTTSCLELHNFNLSDKSLDLSIEGSITTESRFNKLLWSDYSNNLIIGGCENGSIYLYDYEAILSKKDETLVKKLDKHTGVVSALDINPFQSNLLASGAGSSEILIWDLNTPNAPMTPGAKQPPLDDIQCVAWNRQVQHILASTCSGKCVVWDLRKNESIIKVSDSTSKLKAKNVAWHPDVATQMCLSSEDDHSPYLQIWDLRFATSPVKLLEGHHRGILTFCWCPVDSNLLVSCAKDNQILCWNPNTNTANGEIIYEIPGSQWCFDLSWCSRYPSLIATASFESLVSVYSLMGGKYDVKPETSSKIMDSFGVSTTNTQLPSSQQVPVQTQVISQLKLAPKWMKRPCGVSFGFGGKLVTFGIDATAGLSVGENQQQVPKAQTQNVSILQVTTDHDLVEKSQQLEAILNNGQLIEFCNYKIQITENNAEKEIWQFILGSFDKNKKQKFVDLLGFSNSNVTDKIQNLINSNEKKTFSTDNKQFTENKLNGSSSGLDTPQINLNDLQLDDKTLNGLVENHDNSAPISRAHSPLSLCFSNETENLLCQSLLLGRYESAVDLCISENRYADAILIATFAGKELLERTQERYFKNNSSKFSKLLHGFLNQDWVKIVSTSNLNHWKEALAAILTYSDGEQLTNLCNTLGNRLENDNSNEYNSFNACICYICSSSLDNLVNCWYKVKLDKSKNSEFSNILQDLIEKVMVLRYSLQNLHGINLTNTTSSLNSKLIQYSKLLAEQGCFLTAFSYIKDTNDKSLAVIKDRLYNALGNLIVQQYSISKPECPFAANQQAYNKITNSLANQQSSQQHQNRNLYANKTQPIKSHQQTTPANVFPPSYQTPARTQPTPPPPSNQIYNPPNNNNWQQSHQQAPPLNQIYNPPVPTLPNTMSLNNTVPPSSIFSPQIPLQQQQQQEAPKIRSYQDMKPSTAWNDPPIVQPKIKAPAIPKDIGIDPSINIYQPTIPQQNTQPASYNFFNNNNMQSNQTNLFNPMANNNVPVAIVQPSLSTIQPNQYQPQQYHQPQIQEKPHQVPVIEQPKLPIPQEHLVIQQILDSLLRKCMETSNSPAVKRKLEDVAKKLDSLYDKLREQSLSVGVLQGLHALIQYIQAYDYPSSLQLHSNIVATSNFSEVSTFMPGVKVLIQSCQQMNVTL